VDGFGSAVLVVVLVAVIGAEVLSLVVCGLKGKQGLTVLGIFFHPCWWVGAIRLATPTSWWARRFYGPEKRERADARFGGGDGATAWSGSDRSWNDGPDGGTWD
jgi:hypothetical protein